MRFNHEIRTRLFMNYKVFSEIFTTAYPTRVRMLIVIIVSIFFQCSLFPISRNGISKIDLIKIICYPIRSKRYLNGILKTSPIQTEYHLWFNITLISITQCIHCTEQSKRNLYKTLHFYVKILKPFRSHNIYLPRWQRLILPQSLR